MATYNAAFEATPAGSDAPSEIDDKINELKEEIRIRIGNEHGQYVNTANGADGSQTADWCHRTGSAIAYYQSDAPTTRPDGTTALDSSGSNDDGRVWISNGSQHPISVWSGGTWFSTSSKSLIDQSSGFTLKTAVLSLGSWNMDTTASVVVTTGVTMANVVGCDIIIFRDGMGRAEPIYKDAGAGGAGAYFFSAGLLVVERNSAKGFDSGSYNSTGFNRGFARVWYYE